MLPLSVNSPFKVDVSHSRYVRRNVLNMSYLELCLLQLANSVNGLVTAFDLQGRHNSNSTTLLAVYETGL